MAFCWFLEYNRKAYCSTFVTGASRTSLIDSGDEASLPPSPRRLHKSFKDKPNSNKGTQLGRSCGTAVERTPCNREVLSLIPAGCWDFLLLLPSVMCP